MNGLKQLPETLPARWRAWWGRFRVFEQERYAKARVSLELAKRNALRANIYVEVFSSGRFPFFRREHQEAAYCVRLPLPVVLRMAEWITLAGQRARYQKGLHTWREKFEDLTEERPHLRGEAKAIAEQLRAAQQSLKAGNRAAAVKLYNEAHRRLTAARLQTWERAELQSRSRKLYQRLTAKPATTLRVGGR